MVGGFPTGYEAIGQGNERGAEAICDLRLITEIRRTGQRGVADSVLNTLCGARTGIRVRTRGPQKIVS
jgi:hypothetical protein